MQTLRHLVIGTDFSACAEQALAMGITLAVGVRARITLVHVCEHGSDDCDDARLASFGEALSAAVARHREHPVEMAGVVRFGKPWEKLENVATEVGAGLLVVGRHGAGSGRSAAIGSVAALLIRTSRRPVLTVSCDVLALPDPATA